MNKSIKSFGRAFLLAMPLTFFAQGADARIYSTFADVAEGAIPGVVNIRTTSYMRGRDSHLDPYQFFLNRKPANPEENSALGSGVIVDPSGYIVTNYHVIEGASTIEILFAKTKRKTGAKVIGTDRATDLALLKIAPPFKLHALDFGDSEAMRVGDIVLAIGNPFGFAHTVTSGIISAKGRVIGTGPYDSFLQTDAHIHPGNSGGPLIDIRGRVVGINTAVSAEGEGIGFAIPVNMVRDVIKDLKAHGKVIRSWLGVVGKNIVSADEIGDAHDPIGVYGVIVENLIVDSPSHKVGMRIGDLIMALDEHKVFDINDLKRHLATRRPFDTVKVRIYRRNSGFLQIPVVLGVTPDANELPSEKDLF